LQCHTFDVAVGALVANRFAAQQPGDDLQRLGQGRLALADRRVRQTHGAKLKLHVAGAEAEDDPPL
jgi:hypothetical protein